MTADDLRRLLAVRFPEPEYAVFFEVPNATGARATGWCDAMVIGLWPSRGLLVHGFEIKVSRGDWLRELKDPSKAEAHARYCDRWSLLVSDPEIVKAGELPANWGLWAPRAKGLTCVKEAQPLAPAPVDRLFLAALARSAQKMASTAIARSAERVELERRLKQQRDELAADFEERVQRRLRMEQPEVERLRAAVKAFEEHSGVSISDAGTWGAAGLGDAVRALHTLRGRPHQALDDARERLREALTALDAIPREVVHTGDTL